MGSGHQNFFSGHPCMPSASFLEGRVAACSFLGSGVATRPYHTVCPTPIPVVCLSLVIRAAHTDLVRPLSFRSATLLASHFAFQVIRRPAAPIEFCRPHAPTGLELDPIPLYRKSIEPSSDEHLSKIKRTSMGHLSKVSRPRAIQRTSAEHPLQILL